MRFHQNVFSDYFKGNLGSSSYLTVWIYISLIIGNTEIFVY